jgi:TorA maturation chaperone TorD
MAILYRAGDSDLDVDRVLCRGALYELLATLLRPPAAASLERLRGADAREGLTEVAEAAGGEPVSHAVKDLVEASALGIEDLEGAYRSLFGHTARGKVCPYETEYGSDAPFRQLQELADVAGFYAAFGLALPPELPERPDHLAVECEFLSFLCSKEAYLGLMGDLESMDVVRQAERDFLEDHFGKVGAAFAGALIQAAEDPFFQAAGRLCFQFLASEHETLGLSPAASYIQLRSADDLAVPMACASCSCEALDGDDDGDDDSGAVESVRVESGEDEDGGP